MNKENLAKNMEKYRTDGLSRISAWIAMAN